MKSKLMILTMLVLMVSSVFALGLEFKDKTEYDEFVSKWTTSTKQYHLVINNVNDEPQNAQYTITYTITISGTYDKLVGNETVSVTEEFDRILTSSTHDKDLTNAQIKTEIVNEAKRLIQLWKTQTRYNARAAQLEGWSVSVNA